jgi:hypothetical protein
VGKNTYILSLYPSLFPFPPLLSLLNSLIILAYVIKNFNVVKLWDSFCITYTQVLGKEKEHKKKV